MQTLKLSISLPDDTHSGMPLQVAANDADGGLAIDLPMAARQAAKARPPLRGSEAPDDDYVLGGYAGI